MPRINPEILAWARESAGLTIEEAARAVGLSGEGASARLAEMETGDREPSRPQLLKMAERYRRPLLTFYMPVPPARGARTHDFRTLPHREAGSEAIIEALIRDVKLRQALVRDALEDAEEAEVLPFVASVNARSGPDALATAMREMLRFDRAIYRGAKSIEHAFGMLRDAVEATGVYVVLMGNLGHFRTNLSPRIFRGMALADPVAPFIVINETDSKSAWPFTLLHELGHILLGQSGISGYESGQMIERLCDDAAARFLLDRDELQALTDFNDNVEDMVAGIGVFANARKVSRKMVAYNMLKVGTIDATLYRRLAERFDEDRRDFPKKPTGGSGPDYYVVRRHRVGSGLVNLVNRMLAGGALTSTKAGKVLGVKPTAVGRMTERAG